MASPVLGGVAGRCCLFYHASPEVPAIFTPLRGAIGDPRPHHISNGLYLIKLMDSISLPYLLVEERKAIARIPEAFKHLQVMNRPVVVAFTEAVLCGEA